MAATASNAARADGSRAANSLDAENAHRDSGEPVIQHWLLEPRRAPETRRNPIMRLSHGAGDRGVARLVRANEAKRAQAAEQAHVEEDKNKRNAPERNLEVAFFGGARADWRRENSSG